MKEITITKGTLQYRVYSAALEIWYEFRDSNRWAKYRYLDQTNLCHFVRTIVVYAPIAIFANLLVWATAIAVIIGLPIHLFGGRGYSITLGSVAVFVGLCIGIKKLKDFLRERMSEARAAKMRAKEAAEKLEKSPGFIKIAVEYLAARKAKICPAVVFVRPAKEVNHAQGS